MELTTRGRYAVTAMADLARHGSEGPLPLSAIAERQQISLAYLEQLFAALRRQGLVESVRGRTGGYKLGRAANEIRIAEIMQAVEEGTRMTRCGGEDVACVGREKCVGHNLWHALGDHIASFLSNVSLADVVSGQPIEPGKGARGAQARVAAE